MFYLTEKSNCWIFVPLSPDARKFIEARQDAGIKKNNEGTQWELTWGAAADVTEDALVRKLRIITPDKLNYLKAVLK